MVLLSFLKGLNDSLFQLTDHFSFKILLLYFHTGDKIDNLNDCQDGLLIIFLGHDTIVNKDVGTEFAFGNETVGIFFGV